MAWVDAGGDQLVFALLELLGRPNLPALRVGLVHVGPLRLQLQIVLARALVDLEWVESVALKVGLAIEVHLLERELVGAHAACRPRLFHHPSDGCFLALVLLSLLLLQLVHHCHFFNRCTRGSHWSFVLWGCCGGPWVRWKLVI